MLNFLKDSIIEEIKEKSAIEDRTLYLYEDVTQDVCFKLNYYLSRIEKLDKELEIKPSEAEPIKIIIHSYGGSVYDILSTISIMESLIEKGYQIHTECIGVAMSAGSALLQVGTHRVARRYSTILYHQMSAGAYGTMAEITTTFDELSRLQELLTQIALKHTNMSKEYLESMFKTNRDFYLTPEQAIEYGIIDEVI